MRRTLTLVSCLLLTSILWSQNRVSLARDSVLLYLEDNLNKGHKRSLRDLGSLLARPEQQQEVRAILQQFSLFTPSELDLDQINRDSFFHFYYTHETQIQYTELLNAYYLTPLEARKVNFILRQRKPKTEDVRPLSPRLVFTKIDEALEANDFAQVQKHLNNLRDQQGDEVAELRLGLLQDERLFEAPVAVQQPIYEELLVQLEDGPSVELIEIMLQMLDVELIDEAFALPLLVNITNVSPEPGVAFDHAGEYYQHLVDSLETLDAIRRYGYDRVFNFRRNFFQFPVDYYAKVLGRSADYPWIKRNALLDLKQSHHPRSLFYIIADYYRHRHSETAFAPEFYTDLLSALTKVEVGVENQNGQTVFFPQLGDETATLNYLTYWAAHCNDFEWDENREVFTNKLEALAKTQTYERLFRRLNSRNDSVAMASFLLLTEGDPVEIKSLARKYRQLLRNYNAKLPPMKYQYLEQLSQLTAFCRENEIDYQPKKTLQRRLDKLLAAEDPTDRYHIENYLIKHLDLEEITALEYWAAQHVNNTAITFSIGRVLDWFYSNHWEEILQDSKQLRLYLKKSYLMENIGVVGICNAYLTKFNSQDGGSQAQLEALYRIESDEDILNQISLLLTEEPEDAFQGYGLSEFLNDPLAFNRREVKLLPAPQDEELLAIVERIKTTDNRETIKQLFYYLRQHPDLKMVPGLFQLIEDERIISQRDNLTVSVADNIIPIIENVYDYQFPVEDTSKPFATAQWRKFWQKNRENYLNWAETFFQEKLDSLMDQPEISIEEINQLAESPHFGHQHKPQLLRALKNVKPIKNIRRLYTEPRLAVQEDLQYFQDFYLNYKELDDIPKLFLINHNSAASMFHFLEQKAAGFSLSEKGSFYNNLFRQPWVGQYLNSGQIAEAEAQRLREVLENYLNNSDFLSEYEEQNTLLHIAQLDFLGKTLAEKIDMAIQLDWDETVKRKILESIIAMVNYDELDILIERSDALEQILGASTFAFLSRDFGLPIFSINTLRQQQDFLRHHARMSEYEFYFHYLKKFEVDFLDPHKQLDFRKIYNILQFDNTSPFMGSAGGKRDYYTYGIIKLLELHFDTRLGFHEKLNESQTFYNYSSTSRAKAWMEYLKEHRLFQLETVSPPSFNTTRKDQM